MPTPRLALPFLLAGLLTACAAPQAQWEKDGTSSTQVHNAYAGCRYEIGMSDKSDNEKRGLMQFCMERDGFRLQP